ncbi:MAG: COX15/CtaA family protein [Rhodospirillales bacterium]
MAVIGAITRLTESGLSIMEWAPISGSLPPLSLAEWERLFALYRTIPEYQQINAGMSLEEFQTIFWWEWVHRLWGRLIGLVYALPFFWFLWRRRVPAWLVPHLWVALALGGLQGFMGWFMVASGFADRTDVSQYRLVLHLGLALAIYGYLLILALRLLEPEAGEGPAARGLRRGAWVLLAVLVATLASGGLVAGLNAGLVYNSYPLMDGDLIPRGYGLLSPWLANLGENVTAVQFNHRLLAHAALLGAILLWVFGRRRATTPATARALVLLPLVAAGQFVLGIVTLLSLVPVWLGALHQAGAILLLSALLLVLHRARPRREETA